MTTCFVYLTDKDGVTFALNPDRIISVTPSCSKNQDGFVTFEENTFSVVVSGGPSYITHYEICWAGSLETLLMYITNDPHYLSHPCQESK